MKRKTPRKRLDAMPSGIELERIARQILTQLGESIVRPWLAIYDPSANNLVDLATRIAQLVRSWLSRQNAVDGQIAAAVELTPEMADIVNLLIGRSGRQLLLATDDDPTKPDTEQIAQADAAVSQWVDNAGKVIADSAGVKPTEKPSPQANAKIVLPVIETWIGDAKKLPQADSIISPITMASKFTPVIEAWIDESGRNLLVSLDQQDADQWLVRAPDVIQAARNAVVDLCQETIDQFTTGTLRTLEGMRIDLAASIESGETAGELTKRISAWVKDNARWRARRIAITESARAFNTGLTKAAEGLDFVAGWKLLLSGDACPMCQMIFRLCPIIVKGGTFGTNGNNKTYKDLKFPPFHPGCRCSILEVFEDEMPKSLRPPVRPGPNGYLQPTDADYAAADAGGYLSVAIGNAKSFIKTGRILEDDS